MWIIISFIHNNFQDEPVGQVLSRNVCVEHCIEKDEESLFAKVEVVGRHVHAANTRSLSSAHKSHPQFSAQRAVGGHARSLWCCAVPVFRETRVAGDAKSSTRSPKPVTTALFCVKVPPGLGALFHIFSHSLLEYSLARVSLFERFAIHSLHLSIKRFYGIF